MVQIADVGFYVVGGMVGFFVLLKLYEMFLEPYLNKRKVKIVFKDDEPSKNTMTPPPPPPPPPPPTSDLKEKSDRLVKDFISGTDSVMKKNNDTKKEDHCSANLVGKRFCACKKCREEL